MKESIKLFRALEIKNKKRGKINKDILKETVRRGFVFAPEIFANYTKNQLMGIINLIEKELSLTPEKMNSTFHKSFKKVRDAPIEQLIIEQILHYFTTYGFERMGIYDENYVYIPAEKLKIPELKQDIPLIIIKGYTKNELKKKILDLIKSGIALEDETIEDIVNLSIKLNYIDTLINEEIPNKELKIRLYEISNKIPENPVEFLRYLIYTITGKALLIKSQDLFQEILYNSSNVKTLYLYKKYLKQYGEEKLASIFYRFKPLFIALKKHGINANRLRRLAEKYHKPFKQPYINTITERISNNTFDLKEFKREIKNANIFVKSRILYALKFRASDPDVFAYRIRNGKFYVKASYFNNSDLAEEAYNILREIIIKEIAKKVKGKKIYIPEMINYALPTSEKNFFGNIPVGTSIIFEKGLNIGVHWLNTDRRVDLDLSLIGMSGKIGWDGAYRDGEEILFSGDMTDAPKPHGAAEVFRIKELAEPKLMFLNFYNYGDFCSVDYKLILTKKINRINENCIINPNDLLMVAKNKLDSKQRLIGYLTSKENKIKFTFLNSTFGKSITSRINKNTMNAENFLEGYFGGVSLNEILTEAGAKIVKQRTKNCISLALEDLEKDSIINLIK